MEKAPARTQREPSTTRPRKPRGQKEVSGPSILKEATGSKDAATELKGIPKEVLEERTKAEVCLKVRDLLVLP